MKILALSDKVIPFIYSPTIIQRFPSLDMVIGCGDLPYYYLEFAMTILNISLFFVRGNHDKVVEYGPEGYQRTYPHGGVDLHSRVIQHNGVILAGVEGSLQYSGGRFQYSQTEMWQCVFRLIPSLLLHRMVHGRYLDIFVTHAPPAGVNEQTDWPHRGVRAFRWLINVFQPAFHLHGHVHPYKPGEETRTKIGKTIVVNAFGFREIEFFEPESKG